MEEPIFFLPHYSFNPFNLLLHLQSGNGRCEDDDGSEPYSNSSRALRVSELPLRISHCQFDPHSLAVESWIEKKSRYTACAIHFHRHDRGSDDQLGDIVLEVLPEYANALVNSW